MSEPRLFRVAVPLGDFATGLDFYRRLLAQDGASVGSARHYFHCGHAILACFDPGAEGHGDDAETNDGPIYFAVDDLDARFDVARGLPCTYLDDAPGERAWGERSFYARDPFGNRLCFVDASTVYTGPPDPRPDDG